MMIVYLGQSNT